MKPLLKRLERLEEEARFKSYAPVLFVDDEKDIEKQRHKVGQHTVIFIDDIGEESA